MSRIKIGDATVKVALEATYNFIADKANKDLKVSDLLGNHNFVTIITAQKGGSTEENWLTVDNHKVGRSCAMLNTFYPHNNESKEESHFYKNGSYHIVVEKLKNLKVKAHKADQANELARLEDDMMEGTITPKEWKAAKDAALGEFKFTLTDETKKYLVELTQGYETKEALAVALADEAINTDFTEIEDKVNEYLATVEAELFPKPEETTEEA